MPQEFADIGWAGPANAQGSAYTKRYLVWHATANNASPAAECAFARNRTDGIGLHICGDASVVLQALETKYGTGHVGSSVGNHYGIAFEMVGTDASSTEHWKAIIDRSAYAVREICAKWGIPARWLSSSQANDGHSKGWLTHDDARRYWGQTTHTDPGPNFPRQYALDAFNRVEGASEPPDDGDDMFLRTPNGSIYLAAGGKTVSVSGAEWGGVSPQSFVNVPQSLVDKLLVPPAGPTATEIAAAVIDALPTGTIDESVVVNGVQAALDSTRGQDALVRAANAAEDS